MSIILCKDIVENVMVKKVIQLVVDEELLKNLDALSKAKTKTRSEIIRQACQRYLKQAKDEEQDRIYRQSYIDLPEEPELGEAQEVLMAEMHDREQW
jgi:metal-responsive CopG/Arc/MetJ family transcriptional regulator